jgi:hypothetical protein
MAAIYRIIKLIVIFFRVLGYFHERQLQIKAVAI